MISSLGSPLYGGYYPTYFQSQRGSVANGFNQSIDQTTDDTPRGRAASQTMTANDWSDDEAEQHASAVQPVEESKDETVETSEELAALESELDELLSVFLR
jgi:methyl-accepting chemotaxis protein